MADFARPVKELLDSGIPNAVTPTGGMGLTLDHRAEVPYAALPLAPVTLAASASLTLTTADQDVAGCSLTLMRGMYMVWGAFDFTHTVNGGGVAVGSLYVGGTAQSQQALLQNTGSANGDRATVFQVWVFTITDPLGSIVKLNAKKTINAGTAQAVLTNTTLTYLRYG